MVSCDTTSDRPGSTQGALVDGAIAGAGFGMLFIVVNIAQIAVVVAILIHLYWPLGLVVLASTVPVVWVSMRTEKAYTRLSRAVQDETGDVASAVEEAAHGLRAKYVFLYLR